MNSLPQKLQLKLNERKTSNAYRNLPKPFHTGVDFISNDYLGIAKDNSVSNKAFEIIKDYDIYSNGATGSRLISGNHKLYNHLEKLLVSHYQSDAAIVYNSGYDANIGFFSSVPQRNDLVLYDELIHASIRDGISMGHSRAIKFKHNSTEDLESKLKSQTHRNDTIYIVTESVFSMDGDSPDLKKIINVSTKFNAKLIVDEAHAIGVMGNQYKGMISPRDCFAKIITFGKAIGTHGAAILCREDLKAFLVNFSRPFIYTTALPPHTTASIIAAHGNLNESGKVKLLKKNITLFKNYLKELDLSPLFIASDSAIQSCIIMGNKKVKLIADKLQNSGYNVKPILSPTVPLGQERLRFCLHSFNTEAEIKEVLHQLAIFVK